MINRFVLNILRQHKKHILPACIFILSLTIRFALCLLNREANDNHMEVINWIVDKNQIPVKENCWECAQPKLYYVLNAGVIKFLGIEDSENRIVSAQIVNFILSAVLLIFIWAFIRNQNFSFPIKIFGFCLLAFNPCLTGINVQATNDTLEILAGTMTIYFADLFFRKWKFTHLTGLTFSVILACITKGSGLSLAFALFILFFIYLVYPALAKRKIIVGSLGFFMLSYLLIVPFAGGYYENYKKYNNAFINNISQKDPPPDFFHQTYPIRPGITSIVHGYFTFRIFNLLKQPYITNGSEGYPIHRTSLWSQLYGRTFFMHFDQHPGSWATMNINILRTGKLLLAFGLVPLVLFLTGCYLSCKAIASSFYNRDGKHIIRSSEWIHIVFASSCILFILKYTYDYRDFATMKSIFVFPVLLSLIYLFMRGFSNIKSGFMKGVIMFALICLTLLSMADEVFLINQLSI